MGDLISRQAVKEWLERWEGYLDKDMISRMQVKVSDIPTQKTPSNTLGALDCVGRQDAIDAMRQYSHFDDFDTSVIDEEIAIIAIKDLPSVQPTTLTEDDKETIRIHLSAFKESLCNQRRWNEAKEYEELISRLLSTPSA